MSIKITLNRDRITLDKTKEYPIYLRITIDRKKLYLKTGIKIKPKFYNPASHRVKIQHPNHLAYNKTLDQLEFEIKDFYFKKKTKEENISLLDIKNHLTDKPHNSSSFSEFAKSEIRRRRDLKEKTISQHLSTFSILQKLNNDKPILFSELDFSLVERIEELLQSDSKGVNTRWKYHKIVKTYINRAIKKGIITEKQNPYSNYQIKRTKSERVALSSAELKSIENLLFQNKFSPYFPVIKKFLFSCYTGLRISDTNNLRKSNFKIEKNKCYLTFEMVKGQKGVSKIIRDMPLHDLFDGKPMKIILELIKSIENDREPVFAELSDQTTNDKLKDVAKFANIKTNLTYHISRHTFGSNIAEKTNDPILIKELMGHSKIETSMIYIHMTKERVESKLKKIQWND